MKESTSYQDSTILAPGFILELEAARSVFQDAKINPDIFQKNNDVFFKMFPYPDKTNESEREYRRLTGKKLCFNIICRQINGTLPKVTPEHRKKFFDYIGLSGMLDVKREHVYWNLYLDLRGKLPEVCQQLEAYTSSRKPEQERDIFQGFVEVYYTFALAAKITI